MIVQSRGLLAACFLLVVAAMPLAAQPKFGYVDSRRILQEMPGRTQAENALRVRIEALGAREKRMVDSLNAMMASFERDSSTMAQAERVARFTALQQYDGQYRDTLEALQAEAQQMQQEAMAPLFDQIRLALEDVRVAEGLAMIFDVGAQVNPIVAMDKNLDVSDRVIARIRAMPAARAAEPAAPAARPPVGPVAQPAGVRKP
jgi:Skp family chaperone for outer membrane proteins